MWSRGDHLESAPEPTLALWQQKKKISFLFNVQRNLQDAQMIKLMRLNIPWVHLKPSSYRDLELLIRVLVFRFCFTAVIRQGKIITISQRFYWRDE